MKENSVKYLLVLLLVCLVVFLIVVLILLLRQDTHSFSLFHFGGETKMILEEEYNTESIDKIVVDTSVWDIKFLPSEDKKVKVVIQGEEKDKATSTLEGNTLTISAQKKNRICFGFCFYGKEEMLVYLPKKDVKEVDLKTISGDILMQTSLDANIKAKTTSGDVSFQNAGHVDIHTTSGDIKIGQVKNASLVSVSGEIEADTINGKMNVTTTSGDIEINYAECTENAEVKSVSGDVKIIKTNNVYIETKSVSGESDIGNNNRSALYTLTIKTTSGDIKVN